MRIQPNKNHVADNALPGAGSAMLGAEPAPCSQANHQCGTSQPEPARPATSTSPLSPALAPPITREPQPPPGAIASCLTAVDEAIAARIESHPESAALLKGRTIASLMLSGYSSAVERQSNGSGINRDEIVFGLFDIFEKIKAKVPGLHVLPGQAGDIAYEQRAPGAALDLAFFCSSPTSASSAIYQATLIQIGTHYLTFSTESNIRCRDASLGRNADGLHLRDLWTLELGKATEAERALTDVLGFVTASM